jgi:hypothetical protein
MGVSTSRMRHRHRHAAGAWNVCACTHIYAGVRPEYSQGTARGSSRAADIGTDAVLIDSILTGYSAGRWVLTGYRFGTNFGTVRVAHGVFVHARMRMRVQPITFSALPTPTPARRGPPRSPTSRRVKPRQSPSRSRTLKVTFHQLSRAAATSARYFKPCTSTPTRPAPPPPTRSRSADSVRRSQPPPGVPRGGVPR